MTKKWCNINQILKDMRIEIQIYIVIFHLYRLLSLCDFDLEDSPYNNIWCNIFIRVKGGSNVATCGWVGWEGAGGKKE
jgi:hypothetical protein